MARHALAQRFWGFWRARLIKWDADTPLKLVPMLNIGEKQDWSITLTHFSAVENREFAVFILA
jgi:hypothetical protein